MEIPCSAPKDLSLYPVNPYLNTTRMKEELKMGFLLSQYKWEQQYLETWISDSKGLSSRMNLKVNDR